MAGISRKSAAELRNGRHFCILPWIHFSLGPQGEVRPCCRSAQFYYYGSAREMSFDELWNDLGARAMRARLLEDRAQSQCRDCYRLEEIGVPSLRQQANAGFSDAFDRIDTTGDDGSISPDLPFLYLDLRFSNLCNFKCRTCSSEFSSSWNSDERKLGKIPAGILTPTKAPEELHAFLDRNIPYLRRLYFAGGEPLLEKEHYLLLEKLIARNRTDIELIYNTNFSHLSLQGWSALELWREFTRVRVAASLDGAGKQGEYLRKGMIWNEIVANHAILREKTPHVVFTVYPTVTAMNAFHLTDAIRQWCDLGMIIEPDSLQINVLREPSYLNVSILSMSERADLKIHYSKFIDSLGGGLEASLADHIARCLQQVLDSLDGDVWTESRNQFGQVTAALDRIRDESFRDLFPQVSGLVAGSRGN